MESVTVYLVSNVSPDLFPNNNPSKFSTNLANEIDFSEGDWEVGVRHIMYPTQIATTSPDDKINLFKYDDYYRNLLPHPPRDKRDLKDFGASINVNGAVLPYPRNADLAATAAYICKQVNESVWARNKELIMLEYKASSKKFIIHIYHQDIALIMTPALAKLLGFKTRNLTKGTHWAWRRFENDKNATDFNDIKMYLYDLTTLESSSHKLLRSLDQLGHVTFNCSVSRNFKDTLPDEYIDDPKVRFSAHINLGKIKVVAENMSYKTFMNHEKKVMFFSFDKESTEKFDLETIYVFEENMEIKIPKQPKESSTGSDVQHMVIKLYYDHARDIVRQLQETPFLSFSIDTQKQVKDPNDLIVQLNKNSKQYGYQFNYDQVKKRFTLTTGSKYFLQMTQSLASVLGFEYNGSIIHSPNTSITASEFPILDRNINALYIYTNIIDPVYIGNVQAPLLLSCPFINTDPKDNVHQQEFLMPYYNKINRSSIHQIDIGIYDDAGTLVPFLQGKTNLSLHFRRKL